MRGGEGYGRHDRNPFPPFCRSKGTRFAVAPRRETSSSPAKARMSDALEPAVTPVDPDRTDDLGAVPLGVSIQDRRRHERKFWAFGALLSIVLHLLLLLVGNTGGGPEDPFSAAGPREQDDRAAEGAMRAVAFSSAPPATSVPVPVPVAEVVEPEPDPEPDPQPVREPEVEEPPVTPPGQGTTTGTDPAQSAAAGVAGATGRGDGGTSDEGRFRLVPATPRGLIIPPTNRSLRGQQIQVWVYVNEQGRVVSDSTRLEPPTRDNRFNEQIRAEASQWIFQPAQQGGRPVASWFPYTISL